MNFPLIHSAAEAWDIALAGVFLPILPKAVGGRLVMRVDPQFLDINVDPEAGCRRQIDPAVLNMQ